MQGKSVWIISVPLQPRKDVFTELKAVAREDTEEVHTFGIPDLRVGNIDSLITLSDELRKLDVHVEGTLRKILVQYEELAELRQDPKNQLVVTKDGVFLTFVAHINSNPFDVYYKVQVGRSTV
jgi:V-type H+-transporting ATPase subunit C